jgi:hypothetical protein
MKRVGARPTLLGVLKAKSIHGKQMRLSESGNAVLALQHGIKHGPAILEILEQHCATTAALGGLFLCRVHQVKNPVSQSQSSSFLLLLPKAAKK